MRFLRFYVSVTFKRLVFVKRYIGKNIDLTSPVENEEQPMIPEKMDEIKELREVILQMQKDIAELKNK